MLKTMSPRSPAVSPKPRMGGRMIGQTFGARLKQLREQAGLTQVELAKKAGLHQFGVAKLERGERQPTWATVQALCKALGVSCTAFEDTAPPAGPAQSEEPPAAPPAPPPPEKPARKKGRGKTRRPRPGEESTN